MERPRAALLADGRLHLQHGPIDIIANAEGLGRDAGFLRAVARFETILTELADELPQLRTPVSHGPVLQGSVARAMLEAVSPFANVFVTPMAAVAGAVADEIRSALAAPDVRKAYANNGGDVSLHMAKGVVTTAAIAGPVRAFVRVGHDSPVRGVATSGWRGRSHSLGIADSVTVLARTAAAADAAATLIANAVDLPEHPGIRRVPAKILAPDSDLGARLVTQDVPPLTEDEIEQALARGVERADRYRRQGLIVAAYLVLQGETRVLAPPELQLTRPAS